MAKLTKKGALAVTADLDRLANLFQYDHEILGLPQKIAMDAAYRLDLISDHITKKAQFNAAEIGVEKAGPLEQDADEGYMKAEFSQQENRELREEQEAGKLGPNADIGPQAPQSGKQAGFEVMGRQAAVRQVIAAERSIHEAALNVAGGKNRHLVAGLTNLAATLMRLQASIISGTSSARRVASTLGLVAKIMPHVAEVENDEKDEEEVKKVARMIEIVLRTAKKAEDEDEEKDEDDVDEKTESKKAGEVPEAFKKQWEKNKGDKDDDDDKEDKKPDFLKDKEEKSEKKAHGYDLSK